MTTTASLWRRRFADWATIPAVVAACSLVPAGGATAQVSRLTMSGYVSPRCWVIAPRAEQAKTPIDFSAPHVRCSTVVSGERVERGEGGGGLAIVYRTERQGSSEASARVIPRVIVSPIP